MFFLVINRFFYKQIIPKQIDPFKKILYYLSVAKKKEEESKSLQATILLPTFPDTTILETYDYDTTIFKFMQVFSSNKKFIRNTNS